MLMQRGMCNKIGLFTNITFPFLFQDFGYNAGFCC